jgi:hypothetical protein
VSVFSAHSILNWKRFHKAGNIKIIWNGNLLYKQWRWVGSESFYKPAVSRKTDERQKVILTEWDTDEADVRSHDSGDGRFSKDNRLGAKSLLSLCRKFFRYDGFQVWAMNHLVQIRPRNPCFHGCSKHAFTAASCLSAAAIASGGPFRRTGLWVNASWVLIALEFHMSLTLSAFATKIFLKYA